MRLMRSTDMTKEEWLSEFVEVNVADLGDAHAVKGGRKAAQEKIALCDLDPVALDFA